MRILKNKKLNIIITLAIAVCTQLKPNISLASCYFYRTDRDIVTFPSTASNVWSNRSDVLTAFSGEKEIHAEAYFNECTKSTCNFSVDRVMPDGRQVTVFNSNFRMTEQNGRCLPNAQVFKIPMPINNDLHNNKLLISVSKSGQVLTSKTKVLNILPPITSFKVTPANNSEWPSGKTIILGGEVIAAGNTYTINPDRILFDRELNQIATSFSDRGAISFSGRFNEYSSTSSIRLLPISGISINLPGYSLYAGEKNPYNWIDRFIPKRRKN